MKKGILFFLLLFSLVSAAQPPDKFYTKYGGTGIDIGYGVQEIYKRQYIVVGSTTSFGNGGTDAYLFLVDSMASVVWQKSFGGVSADVGKSVIMNPADSGFVFCGFTNSFGNGGYDVYVVRTDKLGNLMWQSGFGGLDWEFGSDLAFSSDGNLVVCGSAYNSIYGKMDGYVLKVNSSNGTLISEKKFGGSEDDDFNRIKPTSDGNLCMSGNTKSYGDLNNDFWFFKVDNNCDSVTSANLGNPNKKEYCYDFIENTTNQLVFCGSYDTSFYNTGKNICYVLKTSLNGSFISDFKVSGAYTNDDKFSSLTSSKQGNEYFLTGKYFFPSIYGDEIRPFVLDYNYIFIQATTYGDVGNDESYKAIYTSDNGFMVVGSSLGPNQIAEDVFLLKLNHSILGTNPYVGINENTLPKAPDNNIYYFENTVYIDNKQGMVLTFQIMDSQGKIVQTGITNGSTIPVNPGLAKDIYLVRILEQPGLKTKFIKD